MTPEQSPNPWADARGFSPDPPEYTPRRAALPVEHNDFGPPDFWSPAPPPADPHPPRAEAPVPPPPAAAPARPQPRWGRIVVATAVLSMIFGGAAGAGSAHWFTDRDSATSTAPEPVERPADPAGQQSQAPPPVPETDQADTVAVAEAVLPSTVTIQVRSRGSSSAGSGVVLDTDGHILTNNHVIEEGASGAAVDVLLDDGARVRAEITGRSPSYDLAVIKIPGGEHLRPAVIGDSSAVRTGQLAVAVGSPLGLGGSVTAGIISARDRAVKVGDSTNADAAVAYINALQTDASINPGNSGGPLVDGGGRVIGINSAILTLSDTRERAGSIGVGFAIPINQAMVIVDELLADGQARYPVIGAQVQDTGDDSGVTLIEITADGPAARAGLRAGDKIVAVDGRAVYNSTELIVQIRTHRPGETVPVDYVRGGTETSVDVALDGRVG